MGELYCGTRYRVSPPFARSFGGFASTRTISGVRFCNFQGGSPTRYQALIRSHRLFTWSSRFLSLKMLPQHSQNRFSRMSWETPKQQAWSTSVAMHSIVKLGNRNKGDRTTLFWSIKRRKEDVVWRLLGFRNAADEDASLMVVLVALHLQHICCPLQPAKPKRVFSHGQSPRTWRRTP